MKIIQKYKPNLMLIFMSYVFMYAGSVTIILRTIVVERSGFQFRANGVSALFVGIAFIFLSIFISNRFEKYYDEYMGNDVMYRFEIFEKCWKYVLVIIPLCNLLVKISADRTVFYICDATIILSVIISMIKTQYNVSRKI